MTHDDFFKPLVSEYKLSLDHPVVSYLSKKTISVNRDSKARRSLGNLYAIQVLAEDYVNGYRDGTQFTQLLARMRLKPFGSKLQNHPLDNRLNDEFRRQHNFEGEMLPVQSGETSQGKTRKISEILLQYGETNPLQLSKFIVRVVNEFSQIMESGELEYIEIIKNLKTNEQIIKFFEDIFKPSSDARLFEVASFCVLKYYYSNKSLEYRDEDGKIKNTKLKLYKTGRTNANDGGIDFVLKPLGKFFQVTETLDFKKYFLDFDKLNRVPISFVIKIDETPEQVLQKISQKSLGKISEELHSTYLSLFEEIITNMNLRQYLLSLLKNDKSKNELLEDLETNFKVEYGHYD
jgi:hypothetical protein